MFKIKSFHLQDYQTLFSHFSKQQHSCPYTAHNTVSFIVLNTLAFHFEPFLDFLSLSLPAVACAERTPV